MRVNPPSPYAYERSRWILRQMTQLTGIAYVRPEHDSDEETNDIDPLILDTEFLMDESIRDTLQVMEVDTSTTDSLFLDLDLIDPLFERNE